MTALLPIGNVAVVAQAATCSVAQGGFMCTKTKLRTLTSSRQAARSPVLPTLTRRAQLLQATGIGGLRVARMAPDSTRLLLAPTMPPRSARSGPEAAYLASMACNLARPPRQLRARPTIWWQVEDSTWLLRPWMGAHEGAQWRIGKRVKRAFRC